MYIQHVYQNVIIVSSISSYTSPIGTIIDGLFQVSQRVFSSNMVLLIVESRFATLKYFAIGSKLF